MHVSKAGGSVVRARRRKTSPHAARVLRQGRRPGAAARPAGDRGRGPGDAGLDAGGPAAVLAEWHEMTPGEMIASWAGLRAWVAWLSGRYELSVDNRLPACWALHPGLVEELWALKAWREEVYSGGQPGQGQAARYWHAELQAVIRAATTMYAAGCRTGHRGPVELAGLDPELLQEWGGAYPLAGVPAVDIAAGKTRFTDGWASGEAMAVALDSGSAAPVPGGDLVRWDRGTWAPGANGWVLVPEFGGSPAATAEVPEGEDGWAWPR